MNGSTSVPEHAHDDDSAPDENPDRPGLQGRAAGASPDGQRPNWWYLFRTYLYLAAVIGGAVWFFESRPGLDVSWWWNVPVAFLAVVLVGAGQHQLSALAHEGSHYILFRNRWLNDSRPTCS